MLVLTRRAGEGIVKAGNFRVTVLAVNGQGMHVGITGAALRPRGTTGTAPEVHGTHRGASGRNKPQEAGEKGRVHWLGVKNGEPDPQSPDVLTP
jgi:hypothetical protein